MALVSHFKIKLNFHRIFMYKRTINQFKTNCLLLISLILSIPTFAGEPHMFGFEDSIFSKVLNEKRSFSIKLPEGYEQTVSKHYPVLYTLDGTTHYRRVAGTLEWLSDTAGIIPQHIVVAIKFDNGRQRLRDASPFKRKSYKDGKEASGDTFIRFLSSELIPHIDNTYRTTAFRTLAGHSAAGRLTLYTMTQTSNLFQAYIAMSPALRDNTREQKFIANLASKINFSNVENEFLFVTLGDEPIYRAFFDRLTVTLEKNAPLSLTWKTQIYPLETHMSVPSKTLHNAMLALAIQQGWTAPPSVVQGGLKEVRAYYHELSDKLGHKVIPGESMLLDMAYGDYQAKKLKSAIKTFELTVKLYSNSPNAFDSLADG